MTEYAVLLSGDEAAWEAATEEERREVFARHEQFTALLAQRGHQVVGGAELTHSRTARTVRRADDGGVRVTEGPYAEVVEQLSGFYLVRSDDLDDLLEVTAVLAAPGEGIEVRETVDHGGTDA